MSKIIEELAKQYAEYMCPIGDYCGGVYDEQRNSDMPIYTDDAKSVLTWLFNKPLRDRMTEAEKEKVREIHGRYRSKWDCSCNKIESERSFYCFSLLERIFGKEMFEKE